MTDDLKIRLSAEDALSGSLDKASQKSKEFEGNAKSAGEKASLAFTELKSKIDIAVGAFNTIKGAAVGFFNLAKEGARDLQFRKTFEREFGSVAENLNILSRSVNGTLSEMELLQSGIKLSKLTTDINEVAAIMQLAKKAADDTGRSFDQVFDILRDAIAGGTIGTMDEIWGSMAAQIETNFDAFEELNGRMTTNQRQQFILHEVLALSTQMFGKSSEAVVGFADSFLQAEAKMEDARISLGKLIDKQFDIEGITSGLEKFAKNLLVVIGAVGKQIDIGAARQMYNLGEISKETLERMEEDARIAFWEFHSLSVGIDNTTSAADDAAASFGNLDETIKTMIVDVQTLGDSMEIMTAKLGSPEDRMEQLRLELAAQAALRDAQQAAAEAEREQTAARASALKSMEKAGGILSDLQQEAKGFEDALTLPMFDMVSPELKEKIREGLQFMQQEIQERMKHIELKTAVAGVISTEEQAKQFEELLALTQEFAERRRQIMTGAETHLTDVKAIEDEKQRRIDEQKLERERKRAQEMKAEQEKQAAFSAQIGSDITGLLISTVQGLSYLMGQAFAGGEVGAKQVFATLLNIIGDFAIQVGTILMGPVAAAFAAFQSFNPVAAIIAGAALIAAGAALKGAAAAMQQQGAAAAASAAPTGFGGGGSAPTPPVSPKDEERDRGGDTYIFNFNAPVASKEGDLGRLLVDTINNTAGRGRAGRILPRAVGA